MPDCIAVVSGGMDSVTLLHYLVKTMGRSPAVISFRYGQKHDKELFYARQHVVVLGCTPHQIADLSGLSAVFQSSALVNPDLPVPALADVQPNVQPTSYVPNRNMIFLALAAALAETLGVNEVFYGAQAHDAYGYWDTTPPFVTGLNRVFALKPDSSVQIRAPFVNHSKSDVLREGLALGIDYATTWSCYEGDELACGRCPTCVERLNAFAALGRIDPLPYA